MTVALSYDPIKRITTGFLGSMVDEQGRGPIKVLIERLRQAEAYTIQPMLLPVLMYSTVPGVTFFTCMSSLLLINFRLWKGGQAW